MAGIISPSMPVWVVENARRGNRAYCNLNEGLGKVLRFGANSPEVLDRLRWLGTEFFNTMQVAVRGLADTGSETADGASPAHGRRSCTTATPPRPRCCSSGLTLALLKSKLDAEAVERALAFVAGNDHFFLNISMAACKSMTDAAHGVPGSSMVTVMARNGVNFGIRLSGTGDEWFQARANPVDGLYFPGYTVEDAAADLGDSAITETNGLGGFAMAASPGHRSVRRRHSGRCHREQPANAVDHSGKQPSLHAAGTQFRRNTRRHRCAARRRFGHVADHQYRHRAQEGRRRTNRCGHHDGADGVLQRALVALARAAAGAGRKRGSAS